MKNVVICPSCGTENAVYNSKCIQCGSFIKDRIVNIDLWSTVSLLIENPMLGFKRIIASEHKNFLVFILLLAVFKFWINANFMYMAIFNKEPFLSGFVTEYSIIGGITLGIILIVTLIIKITTSKQLGTRIKDVFSIISYSLLPHFFAAFILFTIELIVFGGYLFSNNPSPFMLKENAAYILLAFEVLVILWAILLSIFSFMALTKNKLFSVIMGIAVNLFIFSGIYFSSIFIINR